MTKQLKLRTRNSRLVAESIVAALDKEECTLADYWLDLPARVYVVLVNDPQQPNGHVRFTVKRDAGDAQLARDAQDED